MRRVWPTSMAGQIALIVAIALFVAQAINLVLLLRERQAVRFGQITLPAVTRLVDAGYRVRAGRPLADRDDRRGQRGRVVRLVAMRELPPGDFAPEVSDAVRHGFADAGLPIGRVATRLRPPDIVEGKGGPGPERRRPHRLTISVELPQRGVLVTSVPWSSGDGPIVWRLVAQTLILYGFVLLPVLWMGRRIARPLRALTLAAQDFRPGQPVDPLPARGPADVRAVTTAFDDLRRRVSGMLDEKDRMLGAIGHDLRTPLAALRVRVESVEDDTDRQRMVETIDEMAATLEDILSLARLGRSSEASVDVDLSALVDAVVEDFRDLGADVAFAGPGRLTRRVRPTLMRRAVRNLIENAVKYAGAGEVRLARTGGRIAIQVLDRGPGIPPDRMEAVFDPFTRIEHSRNRDTGGIGLGLALTRAIVTDAGGTVTLANRTDGGLVATILLPA